jgi:hypothetical protein
MFTIEVQVHPFGGPPTEDGAVRFACWNDASVLPHTGRGSYQAVPMLADETPLQAAQRHGYKGVIKVVGHPREHGQGHLARLAGLILDLHARGEKLAMCWEMEG